MLRLPLVSLVLVTGFSGAALAEQPVRVTTESTAYCRELALRLAGMPSGTREPARRLGEEGERLCRAGHTRTGIARLRRALRLAQAKP